MFSARQQAPASDVPLHAPPGEPFRAPPGAQDSAEAATDHFLTADFRRLAFDVNEIGHHLRSLAHVFEQAALAENTAGDRLFSVGWLVIENLKRLGASISDAENIERQAQPGRPDDVILYQAINLASAMGSELRSLAYLLDLAIDDAAGGGQFNDACRLVSLVIETMAARLSATETRSNLLFQHYHRRPSGERPS